jgi:hypothetical protein
MQGFNCIGVGPWDARSLRVWWLIVGRRHESAGTTPDQFAELLSRRADWHETSRSFADAAMSYRRSGLPGGLREVNEGETSEGAALYAIWSWFEFCRWADIAPPGRA